MLRAFWLLHRENPTVDGEIQTLLESSYPVVAAAYLSQTAGSALAYLLAEQSLTAGHECRNA